LKSKKKIFIITGSRADYGLLKPLIIKLKKEKNFTIKLVVTGSHLEKKFGLTFKDIEKDKIKINYKLNINAKGSSKIDVSNSFNRLINKASLLLKKKKPDCVIVLGDRYEIFAFALASFLLKIKIFHFAGGEKTPNNYDDIYRNLITKISSFHFVTNSIYKKNLLKMDINKDTIYDFGSLGVENLLSVKKINIKKIFDSYKIKYSKYYFLITYHPTTILSEKHNKKELMNLLEVLKKFHEYTMIFTYPGSDVFNDIIIKEIKYFCHTQKKAYFIKSLGSQRYINLAKNSSLIIGNSSSGLSEVPSLKKISINVGLRQKGRIFGNSVLNTTSSVKNIFSVINNGLKLSHNKFFCSQIVNPYGRGKVTNKVIDVLKKSI